MLTLETGTWMPDPNFELVIICLKNVWKPAVEEKSGAISI